ncbi:hypothetical protein [Leeuwenhoekiella parthenopeia]|uniref:Lipoprotein n=1 Tax=Leeuwenhoekiella parthenopeia TaxID=2890320 RepID=A0ABS8GN43_9FLAO|nr:hypothetical protein [Leeuwenhoekiella parthenopeia]MCC4211407.1 hypothetical protein [Leeuwenhoekiella parthenopeia]
MKLYFTCILAFLIVLTSCKNEDESDVSSLDLKVPVVSLDRGASRAVKNWIGYRELEKDLALITNTNALNAIDMLDDLALNSNQMAIGIPETLATPSILKKVKRIDTEINDFYANVNRSETREWVVEQHIETLVKAFDTLNKELNRSF